MKNFILSASLLASVGLFAQDEAIVIESAAYLTFSGEVKVVLDDISLVNEGNLDVSEGEIVVSSASSNYLSTYESIHINSLVTQDNSIDFGLEGAFEAGYLEVGSGDNVTISDTSSLKLLSSSTVNAPGEITVESGAAFWVNRNVTATELSNVTVERIGPHNSTTGKYSAFGSPVNDSPFSVLGTNAQSWIYEHNEDSKDFTTPGESSMTDGKGYFVAFPGDSDGKITFNGSINYENFEYAITRTNSSGTPSERGFNLIANPFTCPVDFVDFVTDADNESLLEEATIWLWDDFASNDGGGTSDDYIAVNYLSTSSSTSVDISRNGGGSDWDGTINVAQGFFVKAKNSGKIEFKQTMKTIEGNDDDSFYRSSPTSKYWLGISNGDIEGASTLIGFVQDASYEKDFLYDATKFGNGFSVYSLIDESRLAIQGLPTEWLSNYEEGYHIPLGFNVEEMGTYTISLAAEENNEVDALYLNDHVNLSSVNILAEGYSFSTEAGSINDRFTLSIEPLIAHEVLSEANTRHNIIVYGGDTSIKLNTGFEGIVKVSTMSGKLMYQGAFNAGESEISTPSGLYIVSVEHSEGISTYKVKVRY